MVSFVAIDRSSRNYVILFNVLLNQSNNVPFCVVKGFFVQLISTILCRPIVAKRLLCLTVNSISSSSFLAWNGHQALTRFCLNRFIVGTSGFSMSRVHCLADLAPRGKPFRSSVKQPIEHERIHERMH